MSDKLRTFEELCEIVRDLKEKAIKTVWTNGCFDIIHQGHIQHLRNSKEQGDCLIVGVNSDISVREIKGPSRPIQSENVRAEILSGFSYVDHTLIFSEPSPAKYLQIFKPDVYVKGGEYTIETINQDERRIVEGYGGKIILIGNKVNSTTDVIDRIRNSGNS